MDLIDNIFHLWQTGHIKFTGEEWVNTGKFANCVNASSGLCFTNRTADKVCQDANDCNVLESALTIFPTYDYYKNQL